MAEVDDYLAFALSHLEHHPAPELTASLHDFQLWCACYKLVLAVARECPELLSGNAPLGIRFP